MKSFVYQAINGKNYEFSEEELNRFIDVILKSPGRELEIFLTEKVLTHHRQPRQLLYDPPRLMCDNKFKPFAFLSDLALVKEPGGEDDFYHVAIIYSRLGDPNGEQDPTLQFVHNGKYTWKSHLDSNSFFSEGGHWVYNLGHVMVDTRHRDPEYSQYYIDKKEYVQQDKLEEFELVSRAMSRLARLKWKEQACEEYGSVKEAKEHGRRFSTLGLDFPSLYYIDELKEFDKELVELQKKHLNKANKVMKCNGKSYLKLDIQEQETER